MAYCPIYSRMFLEKVLTWPSNLRDMAFEAAKHTCVNPDLDDYKRDYLTPYRQKHPTTDHQYTLYFLVISSTELFFAWINDQSCLHDTRANFPDPCRKEFEKLLSRQKIEPYDQKYHQIVFEVHPDQSKPFKCRSQLLGGEINLVSSFYGGKSYIGHAFSCDEANDGIAKIHATQFLQKLYTELTAGKIDFEIKFPKMGHQDEVELLEQTSNPIHWKNIPDNDFFILKKR